MKIIDRYQSAIRSSNLKSGDDSRHENPSANITDTDVLGAAGLAGKLNPLAFALVRLFTGDNRASGEIVDHLTSMIVGKAYRLGKEMDRVAASVLARLALGWFRDPTCHPCGGHGYQRIEGTPMLGNIACTTCTGVGKSSFEDLFPPDRVELARWLLAEMEKEVARAGPVAMEKLAKRISL